MSGILAAGAYVPRNRLSRKAVAEANQWFNPGLKGLARGERAICNWDEDTLTMAVEAARDCLGTRDRAQVGAVVLASTTAPFADRQNAGVIAEALNLEDDVSAMDVGGSLRAGTSALINALKGASGGRTTLLIAAEHRQSKAAGPQEMAFGDGAAAFLIGEDGSAAGLVAATSRTADFVDHYRAGTARFDYAWEERWVRDEGQLKILPDALGAALEAAGLEADKIDHVLVPLSAATAGRIAKGLGFAAEAMADPLFANLGDCGAAHPLVMLADCLARAKPGETIAVAGWGQGADVAVLRAGDGVAQAVPGLGVAGHLARRREETNYNRYLSFNNLVEQERGIRSELDRQTAVSALYRNRDMVLGFTGGKCASCGTVQFPRSNICVNPNCGKRHTQAPHPMAESRASIQSWTADNLTYTPDPPTHFGMVVFEEGGRLMTDFTDVDRGTLEVGQPVRMMFRIKDVDEKRGFKRYFWKAAPAASAAT